jgi:TolB-like protein
MAVHWKFIRELRRRRIFRTTGLYIVAAWVIVQVASLVFPALDIAESAIRHVWAGVILGLPLMLVFSWLYDVTPQGIVRTPAAGDEINLDLRLRRADYLVLAALLAVGAAITYQLGGEIRNMGAAPSARPGVGEPQEGSIAVLPLENISRDAEQQYFVDGMHEALIADLSRIKALKVISRTSSRRYGNSGKPLHEIGRELGAANIIEGSVYRVGDEVRISIQLIDTASDQLQWSSSYERRLENILDLQSEVAQAIAREIQVLLSSEEESFFAQEKKVDPEAYENYLKGRFHWYKFTEQDLALALEYFQAALEIDQDYALAYIGYADAIATPAHIGLLPASEVFPQAIELVDKALQLDPSLAEAHDLAARFRFVWDFDWQGAERGFQESIRLKPSHPDARIVYSQLLGIQQRWDEMLDEARTGLRLDPLSIWFRDALSKRLAWMGRYDEALAELMEFSEAQALSPLVQKSLWEVYFYLGNNEASLKAAALYYELNGKPGIAAILQGFDGDTQFPEAMSRLASTLIEAAAESYVSDVEIAQAFAFAGDAENALLWLEKAYKNRDSELVYTAAEPVFALVWDDPRYAIIRQRMNLPAKPDADHL